MQRLENKIAIITGSARAIGKSIAECFVAEGAYVIVTDILDDVGTATANELGHAEFMHHDVSDENQWQAVIADVTAQHGRLDILVNNAGVMGSEWGLQDPEHCTKEIWNRVHAINLDSVFLGCKYAIQAMQPNGGAIVNVASRSGIVGVPANSAYASSKAAIRNHTKSVALYCAEQGYNIRCNSVAPANIMTPMWQALLGEGEQGEQRLAELSANIPLGYFGEPNDVAYAVAYLASDQAKYITGTEIIIDGGVLAGSASSPIKHNH
jgi:NAD(P)-dependent dehydrogenase (short-subunit alcohol dehydrogenase family)